MVALYQYRQVEKTPGLFQQKPLLGLPLTSTQNHNQGKAVTSYSIYIRKR